MKNIQSHTVEIPELGISISTGSIARQANGAVTIQKGDTCVLVSACAAPSLKEGQSWFPLTVDYREKFSAAGRFPGGYFKREGRPSEKETLTSRLCDRPLRPLFPLGFMNEVQVIGMLMSTDLIHEPDILMVNGASAALMISDIPWAGPIGCVRVGEVNGEFILNPSNEELFESTLDLIYVGNEREMMMIEGSADQMPEDRFIAALEFAHQGIQPLIKAQKKLAAECGKAKQEFELIQPKESILDFCRKQFSAPLEKAIFQENKKSRSIGVAEVIEEAKAALLEHVGEEAFEEIQVKLSFELLQEEAYRHAIMANNRRADGRGIDDLRPIIARAGVLPKVHGSSFFQRGETQSIVVATLGTARDAQEMDALTGGAAAKSFILHYNFPPFSVGEVGRFGAAGRREIGHGALAERSLLSVMPTEDLFPYAVRLVSEITESNGSSSMASVCAGTLALMDAGVPIIAPVAGISTGLISKRDEKGNITDYRVITDILGLEDHYGDMDFKIAGTQSGVTGFQLDLKIQGLPFEIAKEAIQQATAARHKILMLMLAEIPAYRPDVKESAPRIHQMQIDPEKIGMLIGPGGKNIKKITEVSGAQINILEDNSGKILIYANSKNSMERAITEVQLTIGDIEVGKTYRGIVRGVKEFGAFVECMPGKEGLVHISELAEGRVDTAEDVCKMGDELIVECIGVDERGRVRLSRKAALCRAKGIPYTPPAEERRSGGMSGRQDHRRSRN
jgi:polyribonucleotide nucleotidyltransferase